MVFSEATKDRAFKRSGGQCECRRTTHNHNAKRCQRIITRHGADYHHVTPQNAAGSDGLGNCEVLCVTCHMMARFHGSH